MYIAVSKWYNSYPGLSKCCILFNSSSEPKFVGFKLTEIEANSKNDLILFNFTDSFFIQFIQYL